MAYLIISIRQWFYSLQNHPFRRRFSSSPAGSVHTLKECANKWDSYATQHPKVWISKIRHFCKVHEVAHLKYILRSDYIDSKLSFTKSLIKITKSRAFSIVTSTVIQHLLMLLSGQASGQAYTGVATPSKFL